MKQLIIAEKPSVAQSIATVLGASERKNGYVEGKQHIVSWCVGHLVSLAPADVYDARYAKWRLEDLPILPQSWRYCVSEHTKKQFDILKALMSRRDVDAIVCATDAAREGELIFRLVYQQCGCTKPVKRLWISSLEDSAIRHGFDTLKDGAEYDDLYQAALCRAQADWLVGINATRLFSLLYGQTLHVGRVMSPTLALLASREAAISAFVPETFYTVHLDCGFMAAGERTKQREEAEQLAALCHQKPAVVRHVQKQLKTKAPPKLYDLTTLQRDANRVYGFSAQQTLDYAQTLYEKKLLTYPRTDSRFVTHDMAASLPTLARGVESAMPFTAGLNVPIHPEQVINDARVSDHHALLPTRAVTQTTLAELPDGERAILHMVCVRLLCALGDAYQWDESTVTLECEGHSFVAKGKSVEQMGWMIPQETFRGSLQAQAPKRDAEEQENPLPQLKEGQRFEHASATAKQGKTVPPKHLTEDTLLAAMEAAGGEDAQPTPDPKGLGTPATRAGIIEKLVKTGLVERKGGKQAKHLLPTDKGAALITVLPEQLQSPCMTAEWEHRLKEIECGEGEPQAFLNDITEMLTELVYTSHPMNGAETLFPPVKWTKPSHSRKKA